MMWVGLCLRGRLSVSGATEELWYFVPLWLEVITTGAPRNTSLSPVWRRQAIPVGEENICTTTKLNDFTSTSGGSTKVKISRWWFSVQGWSYRPGKQYQDKFTTWTRVIPWTCQSAQFQNCLNCCLASSHLTSPCLHKSGRRWWHLSLHS